MKRNTGDKSRPTTCGKHPPVEKATPHACVTHVVSTRKTSRSSLLSWLPIGLLPQRGRVAHICTPPTPTTNELIIIDRVENSLRRSDGSVCLERVERSGRARKGPRCRGGGSRTVISRGRSRARGRLIRRRIARPEGAREGSGPGWKKMWSQGLQDIHW